MSLLLTFKEDSTVSSSDTGTDVGTNEQVELSLNSHDSVQPHIDYFLGSEEEEEIATEEEDCIARRREQKVIKPPSKYTESAFTHALSVAE